MGLITASYRWDQCGAIFPKLGQLLQHRRTMNHWKQRCESCKKSFPRQKKLERHVERHNKENCRALSEIESVLQSYQQYVVDETFHVDIVHVQNPHGKGRQKKPYVDISRLLQSKGSVIQIRNNDELCCARAPVTAIARHEQLVFLCKNAVSKKWRRYKLHCLSTRYMYCLKTILTESSTMAKKAVTHLSVLSRWALRRYYKDGRIPKQELLLPEV